MHKWLYQKGVDSKWINYTAEGTVVYLESQVISNIFLNTYQPAIIEPGRISKQEQVNRVI